MDSYIHAAVLGLIQGLTEFLPISSSGHLIAVPKLLGWSDQGVVFDIALHVATLSAVLIYFRRDVSLMLQGAFSRQQTRESRVARQTLIYLGVATIPVLLVGAMLSGFIESTARQTLVVASLMILVGLLFLFIEKIAALRKDLGKLTWIEALSIGLAQAASLIPGVSRSGATIIGGMYNGLKREAATRFSFLLAIPAILLAAGYSVWQLLTGQSEMVYSWVALAVAFGASLVSGILAIAFMMRFVKNHRLDIFAYYRIVFGIGLFILYFFYGGTLR